jgi:hypothetical protein
MEIQNNIIFKKGDRVCCIGSGLHIECIVLEDPMDSQDKYRGLNYAKYDFSQLRSIKVFDPITEREIWVPRSQIDYDKQYYRDKALKSLGI